MGNGEWGSKQLLCEPLRLSAFVAKLKSASEEQVKNRTFEQSNKEEVSNWQYAVSREGN